MCAGCPNGADACFCASASLAIGYSARNCAAMTSGSGVSLRPPKPAADSALGGLAPHPRPCYKHQRRASPCSVGVTHQRRTPFLLPIFQREKDQQTCISGFSHNPISAARHRSFPIALGLACVRTAAPESSSEIRVSSCLSLLVISVICGFGLGQIRRHGRKPRVP
jgi:hypothetical protein